MTMPVAKKFVSKKLLGDALKILEEGRVEARAAVEPVKVRTYWKLGKRVNEELRIYDGRAGYGDGVVEELAPQLGMSDRTLWRIVRVQAVFKIPPALAELTWVHLEILAGVEDSKERNRLLHLTAKRNWTTRQLASEIRGQKLLTVPGTHLARARWVPGTVKLSQKFPPLVPRKGEFFTYRIIKTRDLLQPSGETLALDLGFRVKHFPSFASLKNPKPGDLVRVLRTKKNPDGDRYRLERYSPRSKKFYETYKAYVTNVIDDDTQWADFDLGFRNGTDPKLRLRGVNAAEIEKGKPASDFVKRTLAKVPFVVISVSGWEKWGRPLADLFYLPVEEGVTLGPAYTKEKVLREGIFLNQQLLDLGLAVRM